MDSKPLSVFDILSAHRYSQTLFASFKLGVFEYINESHEPPTAEMIAQGLSLDPKATRLLLDSCVSLCLLESRTTDKNTGTGSYSNAPQTKRYLLKSSPESLTAFVELESTFHFPMLSNLDSAVKDGSNQWERTFNKPADALFKNLYSDEKKLTDFVASMGCSLKPSTKFISMAFIDLSEYHEMCDIGGADGTLAYTACQHYPEMKITVFDLPQVVKIAPHFKPSSADCPNQGKVSFTAGDCFKDDLPKADLYVMCRVVHDWDDEKSAVVLDKIYKQLPSGGGILLGEVLLNDDGLGPKEACSWSLLMLVIAYGRERSGKNYEELLTRHGFVDVRYRSNPNPHLCGAVFARKP